MRIIRKKITTEQFKARFPIVMPSYKDNSIEIVTDSFLKATPNGTYGMFPINVNKEMCESIQKSYDKDYTGTTWPENLSGIYPSGTIYGEKSVSYYNLHKLYIYFNNYFNILYNRECNTPYSSATLYFDSVLADKDIIKNLSTDEEKNTYFPIRDMYQDYDDKYGDYGQKLYGGSRFYKWMADFIFITLDLRGKDEYVNENYGKWMEYIDYWGTPIISYPEAKEWLSWFTERNEKLSEDVPYSSVTEITECKNAENCCDCVEYVNRGGYKMYSLLSEWVGEAEKRIKLINKYVYEQLGDADATTDISKTPLMPCCTIPLMLTNNIDNLGNMSSMIEEWKGGEDYSENSGITIGNVSESPETLVEYKNEIYKYNGKGKGYTLDEYKRFVFDENSWDSGYSYSEECKIKNIDGYSGYTEKDDTIITGVSESYLEEMVKTPMSYDDLANELPGYYNIGKHSDSYYSQPAEEDVLDLYYQVGNISSMQPISGDGMSEDSSLKSVNYYCGNIITEMDFYFQTNDGDIIEPTIVSITGYTGANEELSKLSKAVLSSSASTSLDGIDKCLELWNKWITESENAHSAYTYSASSVNDTMMCKIQYSVGAYISQNVSYEKETDTENGYTYGNLDFVRGNDGVPVNEGIIYSDTILLTLQNCDYYLSDGDSYNIRYYKTEHPESNVVMSSYNGKPVKSYLANFKFDMSKFSSDTNTILAPSIRKEYDIGYSMPQKIENNIYIERGYTSVLEQHMKIEDTASMDALEKYGNGSFTINKNN